MKTLLIIHDGAFWKNSVRVKPVNYFHKKLHDRSSHRRWSIKKYSWRFRKTQMWIQNSNPKFKIEIQILFFNKVAGLRPATLLKINLWHRYFPLNFAKFLKAYFFKTPLDNCFFIKHLAVAGCSNSYWITNLSYKW